MFTGIVTALGTVRDITPLAGDADMRLQIGAPWQDTASIPIGASRSRLSNSPLRKPTPRPVELAFSARLCPGRHHVLNRFFSDRKHHAKDSAARFVRRCPEPAAMRFDDRATN